MHMEAASVREDEVASAEGGAFQKVVKSKRRNESFTLVGEKDEASES